MWRRETGNISACPGERLRVVAARYRRRLARMPVQRDEGDLAVMLDEHRAWAGTRAHANRVILGEPVGESGRGFLPVVSATRDL
jgi:hypothetical protein